MRAGITFDDPSIRGVAAQRSLVGNGDPK